MKRKKLVGILTTFLLLSPIVIPSGLSIAEEIETSTTQSEISSETSPTLNSSEENYEPLIDENSQPITDSSTINSDSSIEVEEELSTDLFSSPSPEVQALLDSLTKDDLEHAVGADGLGEKSQEFYEQSARAYSDARYENINNYIKKKNFKTPNIERDSRYGTTPKYNYKINKPIGVVVHETANPNSTIQGEINYMYNNYQNAFVHAFTDKDSIIETAPTDFLAWGAGPHANPFFMHIELVQSKTFDDFARSVNNDAYWIATQLKNYGLQPTLADKNNGVGSVISHNAVSTYYGGTNHTDPTGYFASWGYDMSQFFELIEYHYYGNNTGEKPSEPEKYEIFDKDLTIKSGVTFNIHSKPYPYEGFEIIGNTRDSQGTQVHINMKAKTSVATYYNAEGFGWIDSRAFTTSLDTVTKKSFTRSARVKSNALYNFYTEPYNTKGSKRTGETTAPLYGQDVEITQTATNNRTKEVFYLVKDTGWIPENAFDLFYDEENIKSISKEVSIKPGAKNNVHSRPFPYQGFKITGTTTPYQGQQVHLSQEAKTSNGTYYLADDIGWIHANAFTTSLDTLTKKRGNPAGKIKNGTVYNFYSEPYNTLGAKRTGVTTSHFYNQELDLSQMATNNRTKEIFYLVEGQGWIPKAAFSVIYDEENIKSISKDLTITSSANNNVHSRPYPYQGFTVTGTTKPYQGKQVHISEQAETSNGTYYFADEIGWIRTNAFTNSLDSVTKSTFNRDAKVLNKTYFFYKEPYNTKGSERTGLTTDSLKNKDIILTQKAVSKNNGNIYYNVKDYGWVDQKALLIYDVPNYEKINMRLQVKPNVSYNVHTEPYPYKGYKIVGNTKSMKMNNKVFNLYRMATTSNGVYYEVSGYGWVNRDAFQKERTVGAFLGTSRNNVVSELSRHENDRFYLGTPYRSLMWSTDPAASMSPLGAPNKYGPGFNCTGFVAYAMDKSGGDINRITREANAWGGVANAYNWRDALKKNTDYSTYRSVDQLLKSGKAKKGDIIYFEPNYNLPGYDCHIAFFWGNNSSHNRTWHSTGPGNNISHIYSGTPFTMIYLFPMD